MSELRQSNDGSSPRFRLTDRLLSGVNVWSERTGVVPGKRSFWPNFELTAEKSVKFLQ